MTLMREEFELGTGQVTLETGELARQADSAVLVRQGRALVLATVVVALDERPGLDFLPLTVEYRERAAAQGRIPMTFNRREGRITDEEVLVSRLIDRSVRPLFAPDFQRETQLQVQVLSVDRKVDLTTLAILGASAALSLSSVPFDGPMAGMRAILSGDGVVLHPVPEARSDVALDVFVSARPTGLVMVEGAAREIPEARLVELLEAAQQGLTPAFDAINRLRDVAGKTKLPISSQELIAALLAPELALIEDASRGLSKEERGRRLVALTETVGERLGSSRAARRSVDAAMREAILDGRRPDGRAMDEVRPIDIRVGYLPATHGSALFTRGETQVLASATLGSKRSEQAIDTPYGVIHKRFFLHYSFPPYSVGEVRQLRGLGRREIGHGTLASRGLEPVLPTYEQFPYVARVEADVTESNGSSSMATVCAASLALLDAGMPLTASVAGVAMGLVLEGERHQILTDILGDEDHLGDMDFKIAGTESGITAFQMDIKLNGLSMTVLAEALEKAKAARLAILERMKTGLDRERDETPDHAPRMVRLKVQPDAIGAVIGQKGATIRGIQEEFQVDVSVNDDGRVTIFAPDAESANGAIRRIESLAGTVEKGKLYRGVITSVKDYGAFVRIFETAEGLVHISEWDVARVERMESTAKPGDEVIVRVLGTDRGRLSLSRRAALDRGDEPVLGA